MQVQFETVTPIWTGDAWGENNEIKPSSVMGSLRFWFEVYCHFAGIEVKEEEKLNYEKFIEKRKENPTKEEFEILQELGLTLPSQIFGCTGWKSRIEIEKIEFEESKNYPYLLGRQQFYSLKYEKEFLDKESNKKKTKIIIPSWYFTKGFFGSGTITFKTTENIKNSILLPLLNFIEQYAFIGAKNNIGYGRVKFTNIDKVDVFEFNKFGKTNSNINKLVQNKKLITNNSNNNNDLEELIKELIEQKSNMRKKIKFVKQRHYIFGAIERNKKFDNNATKIIPLISKNENGSYSGKFMSIVGIKDFGEKK
jgi:CRISPR-associated protein Cmr1